MTRLPVVDTENCPAEQQDALKEWLQDRGQSKPPGALWRMLVASPSAMRAAGKLGAFVRVGTTIDPLLQEIGAFIASEARGFRFEIDIHAHKLEALGANPNSIRTAADGSPTGLGQGPDAVAALAYAMASQEYIGDDIINQALAVMKVDQFIELVTVIAYFLMIGDLARVLEPDA